MHSNIRTLHLLLPLMLLWLRPDAASGADPPPPLVDGGAARAQIVVGRRCAAPSRFAAEELRRVIRAMSGADCAIVDDSRAPAGPVLAVGVPSENAVLGRLLERAGIDFEALKPGDEGFLLQSVGGDVAIAGAGSRAALYGAYALLERWGCRWCFPGADGEVIPRRPTLAAPGLNVVERPALSYRAFLQLEVVGPATVDWVDWMAKNRMNRMVATLYPAKGYKGQPYAQFRSVPGLLDAFRRRGLAIEAGNHAAFHWIPPAEFHAAKPEFYSRVGGKTNRLEDLRLDRGQLCYANDEIASITADRVLEFARAHPEVDLLSLYTNDGYGYCECARCAALGTPSDAYCTYVDRVARRVHEARPDLRLSFLSYNAIKDPPRVRVFGTNTLCVVATWPPPDQTRLEGWLASGAGQVALYEYYMGSYSDRSFPWVAPRAIADELRTIHRLGLAGVASQCELDNWTAYALNYWVYARMAWDPTQSIDAVVHDYCAHWYAEAAEPMRRYLAELDSQGRWPRDLAVPAARLDRLESLLAAGERAATTAPTRARIRRDRISLDYLKLAWRIEEARRAAAELEGQGRTAAALAEHGRVRDAARACLEHLDRYAGRRVFLAGHAGDPAHVVGHYYTTGYYETALARSEKRIAALSARDAAPAAPAAPRNSPRKRDATPINPALERVRALFHEHLRARAAQFPEKRIDGSFPASREQWRAHAAEVRRQLRDVFNFPARDAALEARVAGRIDRGAFAIEKAIYRAEADNWVTANVYVPQGIDGPLPALICPSGHGGSKSVPYNQYFGQMYARAGCVVLVPDPIGEEERDERWRLGIRGHRIEGRIDRCHALGISTIGKMVYDIVRGVDYLHARPEVDPRRIGCVGHSLGGTLTEYAAAVDARITLSMPTAWTCNMHEIVGEPSCCWRPVGLLRVANDPELFALGAEHCATLVPAGEADRTPMYPDLFARTTFAQARRVYELFGRGDCLALHVTPKAGHQPFHLNRTALAWVERHFDLPRLATAEIDRLPESPPPDAILMAELPRPFRDKSWQVGRLADARAARCDVRLLPAEALRCLAPGAEARPEFAMAGWIAARERQRAARFAPPRSLEAWETKRGARVRRIVETLNLPPRPATGRPRELGARVRDGARVTELRYGLVGLGAYLIVPEGAAHPPVAIYMHRSRTREGGLESARAAGLVAAGSAVLAIDCVPFEETTYLLGTSPTAYNVARVIESIDALEQLGDLDLKRVSCIGEADDAALLAAVIDPRIAALTVATPDVAPPVPGQGYRRADIVPGLAAIAPRALLLALVAPRPLRVETAEPARAAIEAAYLLAGARDRLEFAPGSPH